MGNHHPLLPRRNGETLRTLGRAHGGPHDGTGPSSECTLAIAGLDGVEQGHALTLFEAALWLHERSAGWLGRDDAPWTRLQTAVGSLMEALGWSDERRVRLEVSAPSSGGPPAWVSVSHGSRLVAVVNLPPRRVTEDRGANCQDHRLWARLPSKQPFLPKKTTSQRRGAWPADAARPAIRGRGAPPLGAPRWTGRAVWWSVLHGTPPGEGTTGDGGPEDTVRPVLDTAVLDRWEMGCLDAADESVWRGPVDALRRAVPAGGPPAAFLGDTAWIACLFRLLECYRAVHDAVGLYWLLPGLYLVAVPPEEWNRVSLVWLRLPSGPGPTGRRRLCAGIPAGCAADVYEAHLDHWDYGGHLPVLEFLQQYQCVRMPVDEGPRLTGVRWDGRGVELTCHRGDLLVVVTVGGLPLATASARWNRTERELYVSSLCSATRTGGGSIAIRHLQWRLLAEKWPDGDTGRRVPRIRLESLADGFYDLLGFDYHGDGGNEMVWPPEASRGGGPRGPRTGGGGGCAYPRPAAACARADPPDGPPPKRHRLPPLDGAEGGDGPVTVDDLVDFRLER